ncbi:MAG: ABC transporter ATP-binding protein [Eubacteriales bacterium]
MIKRFAAYYKPHMGIFLADLFAAFLLAVADLFYPMITRSMINEYIPDKNLRMLIIWSSVAVGLYIIKIGLNYFVNCYGHIMGVHMQADMRREVFHHLQEMPLSYFDNNKTGTIMSRIINDLFDISELAHHGPEDLFLSGVLLIGSFILMARINIWLTLIVFVSIPIFVTYSMKRRIKMNRVFKETKVEVGEVNAVLENAIGGIRVSKAYTNKEYECVRFENTNNRFVDVKSKSYKVMGEFTAITSFMTDFLNLTVMVSGGLFVYQGWIAVGDFAAFIIFVNVFMNPIRKLISFVEQYENGMTGFVRFCEIMDEPVEKEDAHAIIVGDLKGDIRFDNVSFSYSESRPVLANLNLFIPQGKRVALVGPSGSGKTTICNILPRFYEIDSGKVTIDGIDITKMTLESLRRNIGIVAQDVFLFTGTIYENIAYGKPDATQEEVEKAAERANIHEFIASLPDGYQTYIGEKGVKLSGGQKQRISIARAFLKNPPILILDEATSALDNTTEQAIQRSLEALCTGRTTLVVAHRLSTIRNADEIIVIDDEGIKEQGSHAQLMKKNGIYAELYRAQFAEKG